MSEYLIMAVHWNLLTRVPAVRFVKVFPTTNPMASFNFSGSDLESALQDAVDAGITGSSLKFSLSGINTDGVTRIVTGLYLVI